MQLAHSACAGLDVHQRTVVVCVLVGDGPEPIRSIETFSTMTNDLLRLSDWLVMQGVTHVAMEATGVYWKPIWNVLEGSFELLLVNPQHIKAIAGRKTDVADCAWIAELLRYGLLRGSFVPNADQRAVRELTRLRTSRVQMRVAEINRLLKSLESANVKLTSVVSDIQGVSARQMLAAIAAGEQEAAVLAKFAKGKLRQKLPELEQALTGRLTPHLRFLIAEHLATIDELDAGIARLNAEIVTRLAPTLSAQALLMTIPGVGVRTAQVLLAEIGHDLRRFPSHRHLAAWAGLAPGNHQSGGVRKSSPVRHGNTAVQTALCEAAHVAARRGSSPLARLYRRIAARRGKQRAIIAVAHKILVIAYHLLTTGSVYDDRLMAPAANGRTPHTHDTVPVATRVPESPMLTA